MFGPHTRRAACALLTTGTLAVASSACEINLDTEGVTATETRTFEVTGRPDLVLETFDGNIEIHSWDRDAIEIEVEKRAMEQALLDEIQIAAEQDGNRVTLKVTGPASRSRGVTIGARMSPGARLRVAMPRAANLQAASGDGSIAVEDLAGTIVLRTEDGSVRAARLSGDIRVHSGDGSIRMERVAGRLDLETTDGTIALDATPTMLRGRTGDGPIRVTVQPDAVMAEDWELTTGDGSVTLTLPPAFGAELDVETSDGSVRATHPGIHPDPTTPADRRERRHSLRATMGQGGRVLRVRTGDGSIRIES